MKNRMLLLAIALSPLCALSSPGASAAAPANVTCRMTFSLSGWSAIYQTATGSGDVTCSNGQTMRVDLDAKGGGLSVGKYRIDDGEGKFSGVRDISDILGTYATAEAHAGAVGSSRAAAMTKGDVSLALSGTGHGWDIGAGFSGFTIKKAQ